ncbi:hypothetical protein [Paraburkholderia sp. GAS32]|uniref:hypothetical protein n=1 Tax=Paraburkholderia sp. GAS32 TaxID=3035129 RepID=UPI003D1B551B
MSKYTSIGIRCTVAEKAELEVRSGGNLSEYARKLLFEDQSSALSEVHARLEELIESVRVLSQQQSLTGEEIREALAKVGSPPAPAKVKAKTGDDAPTNSNPVLKSILLELLLMQRSSRARSDLNAIHAEIERQGLTVWESR